VYDYNDMDMENPGSARYIRAHHHSVTRKSLRRHAGTNRGRLATRFLGLGGDRVLVEKQDPHLRDVLARGRLFPQRVQRCPGYRHECHANAAGIWSGAVNKFQLVTGFALSDKTWWSHSWVVSGETLFFPSFPPFPPFPKPPEFLVLRFATRPKLL
jgi:hypothetical protein